MNRLMNAKKIEAIIKFDGYDDFAVCQVDEIEETQEEIVIECSNDRTISLQKTKITKDEYDSDMFHCGISHIYVIN